MNSEAITQRIWQHSKATGVNKLMLLALAQHADINKDNDGFCWPSYQTLGGMVGLTGNPKSLKRNAIRNLAPLIKAGEVITWEQQGQEGGRGYTNIYLITVGLTNDQIKEIIQRRFKLEPDEVDIALSKVGVKYDTLCSSERVSIKTLIETRAFPKGDKYVTHKAQDLNKGDKGDTRLLDSSLESNPIQESPKERGGKPPAPPAIPPPIPKSQRPNAIPGVTVFVEVTKRHVLNSTQIKEIDERVGRDPPALDRWRETVKAWQLAGNKINNVSGMLDWFKKGIPVYAQKASTNGHYSKSPKRTVTQIIPPQADPDLYTRMREAAIRADADDTD